MSVIIIVLIFIAIGLSAIEDSALDINIHDTYFVVDNFQMVVLGCVFLFFFIYLIKVLFGNFKNNFDNIAFTVAIVLMIFLISQVTLVFNSLIIHYEEMIPSLQNTSSVGSTTKDTFSVLSNSMLVFQLIFILLGLFVSYKIGRNTLKI